MNETAPSRDTVLVVDDSPETLGFLTEAMEADGQTVLVASSGEAALRIIARITPDMILMDAVMPGMDGFETCRRLKANAELSHVPVIFMTGLTETEHVVHALESGGVDYLTKPINLDELRARIRVHLANARSAQSARVALDAAGRHLLALSEASRVLWATPQANRLLAAPPGGDALGAIAARVRDWSAAAGGMGRLSGESLAVDAGGGQTLQLTCLGAIGADEYLFRLSSTGASRQEEATLRQHFRLTQRESEVLMWIAQGKSNRDIAEILGLSPRTVNKHLEQVYTKLGVENRASAAIKATQVLASPLGS
jgi:DNA-binding NarL/FixJ family response regulator